jgi:hypothetical protein
MSSVAFGTSVLLLFQDPREAASSSANANFAAGTLLVLSTVALPL